MQPLDKFILENIDADGNLDVRAHFPPLQFEEYPARVKRPPRTVTYLGHEYEYEKRELAPRAYHQVILMERCYRLSHLPRWRDAITEYTHNVRLADTAWIDEVHIPGRRDVNRTRLKVPKGIELGVRNFDVDGLVEYLVQTESREWRRINIRANANSSSDEYLYRQRLLSSAPPGYDFAAEALRKGEAARPELDTYVAEYREKLVTLK